MIDNLVKISGHFFIRSFILIDAFINCLGVNLKKCDLLTTWITVVCPFTMTRKLLWLCYIDSWCDVYETTTLHVALGKPRLSQPLNEKKKRRMVHLTWEKYVKHFRLLICTFVMYVVFYSHKHKRAIMELINVFIFISFTSEKWLTMNFRFCLCYIYKLVNIFRQLKERPNWKKKY